VRSSHPCACRGVACNALYAVTPDGRLSYPMVGADLRVCPFRHEIYPFTTIFAQYAAFRFRALPTTPPMRSPRWSVAIPMRVGADLRVCPFRHDVCPFATKFTRLPRYSPNMRRFVSGRCRQRPYGGGGHPKWVNFMANWGKMSPQKRQNVIAQGANITANGQTRRSAPTPFWNNWFEELDRHGGL
jgi:hypothetical protein